MSKPTDSSLVLGNSEIQNYEEARMEYPYSHQMEYKEQMTMNYYHWHRFYEILFIQEGRYTLINNRKIIENDRPGIFIHKPFSLHNLNSYGDVYHRKILYISREVINRFTMQVVDQETFKNTNLIYGYPNMEEVTELNTYYSLAALHQDDLITTAQLYSLIIRRIMQIASGGRGEVIRCPFSYIQDVLNYVADNLSQSFTIETIAAQFHVGRSKFQADFKNVTGISYHQYLIKLRLKRAYNMIQEGNSIVKTALECGYSSEAHFIKAFREYWNCTPGQLRESTRSGRTELRTER